MAEAVRGFRQCPETGGNSFLSHLSSSSFANHSAIRRYVNGGVERSSSNKPRSIETYIYEYMNKFSLVTHAVDSSSSSKNIT